MGRLCLQGSRIIIMMIMSHIHFPCVKDLDRNIKCILKTEVSLMQQIYLFRF